MKLELLPRESVHHLAAWTAGACLALVGALGVLRFVADRELHTEAEHTALQWAQFVHDTTPELDALLAGQAPSPGALEHLARVARVGEVFRFKLFDAHGRLLLVSDALNGNAPLHDDASSNLGHEHGEEDDAMRRLVLAGANHIELKRAHEAGRPAVYSEAYVPILRDGRAIGVVEVYVDQVVRERRVHAAFRNVALTVTALLALLGALGAWQLVRRAHKQRQAEERVRYLAHHDSLTGALNRASFTEALQRAIRAGSSGGPAFAVLCIDLDRFKEVNDSLGHAAGDEVLRTVQQRLQGAVRQLDMVARVGGDEFAVLQTTIRGAEDVTSLCQRIVEALAEPHTVSGQRLQCAGSVGAAIYGSDGLDADELLHKADLALYRAKSEGRATYSFYDAGTDQRLQHRRAMTRDLRHAVQDEHLSLHFQPQYERDGTTLSGYEALVRWVHPKLGNIPPSDFIPLAEETGIIEELGRWVLRQACREAARWPSSLSVSVNLSAVQFRIGDLAQTVAEALDEARLSPLRLELEITESLLISDTDHVIGTLQRLAIMGVRIAMDDFGTGYSSLAYLWRFPFDKVKIDRSFTQHMECDPKVDLIVRSIISLAHSLNIRVNAEGVESPAQLNFLQRYGCDELQGFLLGRPAPVEQLRHTGATATPRQLPPRAQTDYMRLDTRFATTQ